MKSRILRASIALLAMGPALAAPLPAQDTIELRTGAGDTVRVSVENTQVQFFVPPNLNTNRITSLGDPTGAQDAATKNYVDVNFAPIGSAFLTIGNSATLTTERAIAVDLGLTTSDGGANGSFTLAFDYSATLASDPAMAAGRTIFGSTGILYEGATSDGFEGLITAVDPTADRTITFPDATGTVLLTTTASGNYVASLATLGGAAVDVSTGAVTITAAAGSGDADYIQNQTAGAQGADFWISGTAQVDGATISLGTTALARTINIGTGTLADTINIDNESTSVDTINIATGNGTNTINIGTGTGVDTINIGTGGAIAAEAITIGSSDVDTTTTVNGTLNETGNTTLGDATSDTVAFTARAASSFTPSTDLTYDLGSVGLRWNNLRVGGAALLDGNTTIGDGAGTDILSFNAANAFFALPTAVTATDGQIRYNSAAGAPVFRWAGAEQNLSGVLFSQTSVAAGDTVNTTVTDTNFATSYLIPASFLTVGKTVRVTAAGVWSSPGGGGTQSLTLRFKVGGTTVGTATSGDTATLANRGWRFNGTLTCITTGAAGTAEVQGICFLDDTLTADNFVMAMPNTATVTVNTTIANTINLSCQPGVSSASLGMTMRQLIVEALN